MKDFFISTDHYISWLENGIVRLVYLPDSIITLEIAKQMVKQRLEVMGGIIRPVFVDMRGMMSINAEARKYLAGREAIKYVSAGAIYLDNYLHYLTGTVFLKIDRPSIPSKLFTDKEKALRWLEPFKNLN